MFSGFRDPGVVNVVEYMGASVVKGFGEIVEKWIGAECE